MVCRLKPGQGSGCYIYSTRVIEPTYNKPSSRKYDGLTLVPHRAIEDAALTETMNLLENVVLQSSEQACPRALAMHMYNIL